LGAGILGEGGMFEIGKAYTIEIMDGGPEEGISAYPNCVVVEMEFPVIKVRQNGEERIWNAASLVFVGALPQ
jgi:hypothetical protein